MLYSKCHILIEGLTKLKIYPTSIFVYRPNAFKLTFSDIKAANFTKQNHLSSQTAALMYLHFKFLNMCCIQNAYK